MKSILFVCLGNICRSPLAKAIAIKYAEEKGLELLIDSAGTGNWHVGEAPCENSIKVAQLHQLDISHYKAKQVHKNDFKTYDMIVGLDSSNIANLKAMGCKNAIKLGNYGFDGEDVPDPYFFDGFEGFETVFSMVESCVKRLIDELV
ncbi:MAG: low molecular weight protein-tyrosine-phosphatase [Candidatus Marinarcus sp.]|uniref:low molecular weight protein-tyrosine-phosphatase n=1 Tax=Candidatus Marinarcus sp. TaxID=3100987 RepID=UPI003B00CCFC